MSIIFTPALAANRPITNRAGNAVLAIAAALPLLLLASLMVVMAVAATSVPARAEDTACTGRNMMEIIKAEDPQRHAGILEAAAETRFADTILFRVEKPGDNSAPSHLFGTMHLTDARVLSLSGKAQAAFDAATTVAIETTDILDEATAQLAVLSRPGLTMFTGDERLGDFLNDDERAMVTDRLAAEGLQFALVERMKPWMLSAMIALPDCEMGRKAAGHEILDISLANNAESDGKKLVGLETMIEQLEAMNSIPVELQVDGLVDTLRFSEHMDDLIETMIILYSQGDIGQIWPLMRAFSEQFAEQDLSEEQRATTAAGYAAFEEIMVDKRNQTMLEGSLPLLEEGGAFIAVGALHLPGENGLAALFEDAGYTVTPVRD